MHSKCLDDSEVRMATIVSCPLRHGLAHSSGGSIDCTRLNLVFRALMVYANANDSMNAKCID